MAFSFGMPRQQEKETTNELVAVIHTVIMVMAVSEELLRDTKGSF